ncbi:hypothetical protein ACG02S_14640 [Roseateles sp. DC23W]|uniref:Uncharacterized protein n=1 Tax=Pelomonas dachongensis TaxID=3299029 RepID=A0ABW7ER76_9BURK
MAKRWPDEQEADTNAGAKYLVAAMPQTYLANMGLVSLVDIHQRLQRFT